MGPTIRRVGLAGAAILAVAALACSQPAQPPGEDARAADDPRAGVEAIDATAATDAGSEESERMPTTSKITLEDIATYPLPGTATPGALRFSPDGRWLTFLDSPDDSLSRELFALDLDQDPLAEPRRVVSPPDGGVSEDKLSPEEKLARERLRQRALGVTQYAFPEHPSAGAEGRMLIPMTGEIWVQDGVDGQLRKLVGKASADQGDAPADDPRPALQPKLSPDGEQVAFVRGGELWVVPAAASEGDEPPAPKQLTKGLEAGKTRGLAEYIAAEEMGRHDGFWWSPDGSAIAFVEVDETHIPAYRIVHQGKDEVGGLAQEDHGYPFAGHDNARVRLGVVPSRGGSIRWIDLELPAAWTEGAGAWTSDPAEDFYLARVDWMPDGRLCAQIEDRRQLELRLLCFDAGGRGPAKTLLTETSEVWINLHDLFIPLELDADTAAAHPEQVGGFLWASEKTGFRHLYLHDADGRELRQLTSGEWMVESAKVDEAGQRVFFTATKDDPRERHLYVVGFDGQGLRKITETPGMHGVAIDRAFTRFVDIRSDLETPPSVTLRELDDGAEIHTLHPSEHSPLDPRVAALALEPPKLVELKAADGETTLYGAIYQPDPAVHGPGPYPTVISVYGGPHAQRVTQSWGMTVDLRAQYLRDHGYLVFKLDNRGASRRGLAFEGALRHDMGSVEVDDQVAGVEWLVAQGLADPEHVAIYGWSYGGYMSAMALARAPETFSVAIAGAPVTHWDGYDTHYTERYMGLPQENPEGYARSSVMAHLDGLRGELLLVHGLIDENVHFRHSARLINAMISAGKDYELQLYPDERHMPRKLADRVYMERRIFDFLRANL
ncbi:DPP IV N-terminal domain-containing protein [Pseudenhygromyxa sp. WMMC2535]|nr:DPP IV N-terminal domain-containing protein [Pseudenhygromyxa sp. WMMC2535]